jgi:hypothetical protein
MWTIGQQYLIRRHMPPPPKPDVAVTAANGKPSRSLRAALAGAVAGGSAAAPEPASAPGAAPPRSPRKKKKRSGRRR